jgi:Rhodopirellula transposase DDE domain
MLNSRIAELFAITVYQTHLEDRQKNRVLGCSETGSSHLIEMIDDEKMTAFRSDEPASGRTGRRQLPVCGGGSAVGRVWRHGRGGRVTGMAPSTIGRGLAELDDPAPLSVDRARRPGGGCRNWWIDLDGLVAPGARGDPMSPLCWTSKSLRRLAAELGKIGHAISPTVVAELLHGMGFSLRDISLRDNFKTREGNSRAPNVQ